MKENPKVWQRPFVRVHCQADAPLGRSDPDETDYERCPSVHNVSIQ